jgi:hypothetical protein
MSSIWGRAYGVNVEDSSRSKSRPTRSTSKIAPRESPHCERLPVLHGEQKMAPFRTHDFTKELAYVSTPQSGQETMETKRIYKKCVELA